MTTVVRCNCTRAEAIDRLIHEISEIVHVETGTRFGDGTNSKTRFILSHREFKQHNMLLVTALLDCGLLI